MESQGLQYNYKCWLSARSQSRVEQLPEFSGWLYQKARDWDPWRVLLFKLLGGRNLRMVWGRLTLCRAAHITCVSALGCLTIRSRPNSKANGLTMLKHLFPLFEYRSEATSGQSVLGWVTAYSDIPLDSKEKCWLQLLATGVVSHREELIKIREGTTLSANGHMQCWKHPFPRSRKLSIIEHSQYLDGWPLTNGWTIHPTGKLISTT
jgi:hypothetical protein